MKEQLAKVIAAMSDLLCSIHEEKEKIEVINSLREAIHQHSPFRLEPVDFVKWVPSEAIEANDYNPNSVAPPEMELLAHSIMQDGYTQPIVAWDRESHYEVIDGFHRNRVGKENEDVCKRMKGYLPITAIKQDRLDRGDRIAATIRHNRASGKHGVSTMTYIVVELKRRNWTDKKIGMNIGELTERFNTGVYGFIFPCRKGNFLI